MRLLHCCISSYLISEYAAKISVDFKDMLLFDFSALLSSAKGLQKIINLAY